MGALSVEQQIARLEGARAFAGVFHRWLVGVGAALLLLALATGSPVPAALGLFFGLVGLAERRAGPNIVAALAAREREPPSSGSVDISLARWSDAEIHHAAVAAPDGALWRFTFVPQGWTPAEGRRDARIWRDGDGAPLLVLTADGVIVPREAPVREAAAREDGR